MTAYPNNSAVPARMVPGMIWPGNPLPGGTVLDVFNGPEALYYPAYHDGVTGHTLVAIPGGAYYIQTPSPVLGLPSVPPDGLWTTEQS